MTVTADNILFMYIYGVMDFKRMTEVNHKSLVKMSGEANPYADSNRLNTIIQLLSVTDVFEMTDRRKPYTHIHDFRQKLRLGGADEGLT